MQRSQAVLFAFQKEETKERKKEEEDGGEEEGESKKERVALIRPVLLL